MANWMSLNKAARKYGVTTEDIRLWAEMKEIAAARTLTSFIVDDDSIQEFLEHEQVLPTREYIASLRQLFKNQVELCDSYSEIIHVKEMEIEEQNRLIDSLNKCNDARGEQIKKIESLIKGSQSVKSEAEMSKPKKRKPFWRLF